MRSVIAALLASTLLSGVAMAQNRPHNVVLFVADGLRPGVVNAQTAPAMDALLKRGVRFTNSHSLFPTFTTANASGMATGHLLGDTGDFSNTIYTAFPVPGAGDSLTPFLENDPVLGDVDEHFAGNYLNEMTILAAARGAGFSTATIGKLGPALIFDHSERTGGKTIVIDDSTGRAGGIPLSPDLVARLQKADLPTQAPTRGDNGAAGNATTPGTSVANVAQQRYFTDVATQAVLPWFKERNKPFVLVYWSRDPDGTQHNQGDSLGHLLPGINGKTTFASIKNADDNLASLLASLKQLGIKDDTDVILTSDHGFSTISKESATSWSAHQSYPGVPAGLLPPGFVALDLAHALGKVLYDPDKKGAELAAGQLPSRGNGLIGGDAQKPEVVVASNGGSDLIYIPSGDKALAQQIVAALSAEDYTSGLFVDDALGAIPGTLPLSAIALKGSAVTPMPAIAVNFRSFATGCADPTTCGVEVADTSLQQGQGMHGSFSRADTRNIMGAAGPGFRTGFEDPAPASNADLGKTIAHLLALEIPDKGKLVGRVLTEAMPNGAMPNGMRRLVVSAPDADGHVTMVATQTVGDTVYFDAAGYPGRTLGLPDPKAVPLD
ncbi:MAG: alkaline phosphatase family protein [Acetobacteraceae bacterium]|nr:alkaline phosphatase family protein [Acetobacteraceae bacterium]